MYLGLPSDRPLPLFFFPLPLCCLSDLQKPGQVLRSARITLQVWFHAIVVNLRSKYLIQEGGLEFWHDSKYEASQPPARKSKHQHARWTCHLYVPYNHALMW